MHNRLHQQTSYSWCLVRQRVARCPQVTHSFFHAPPPPKLAGRTPTWHRRGSGGAYKLISIMSKKKQPRNGFYFFMLDMQQELRQQGRSVPMRDMPVVAGPKWSVSIIFKHYPHDHSNLTLIYNTRNTWYSKVNQAFFVTESKAGQRSSGWSH